jgi:hypothetical protein
MEGSGRKARWSAVKKRFIDRGGAFLTGARAVGRGVVLRRVPDAIENDIAHRLDKSAIEGMAELRLLSG